MQDLRLFGGGATFMRGVKVFVLWFCAFFLMGVLYTAHRGVDFKEAAILSPLFAAVATVWWTRKYRGNSK